MVDSSPGDSADSVSPDPLLNQPVADSKPASASASASASATTKETVEVDGLKVNEITLETDENPSAKNESKPAPAEATNQPATAAAASASSSTAAVSAAAVVSHDEKIRLCVISDDETKYRLELLESDTIAQVRAYLESRAKLAANRVLLFFPDKLGDQQPDTVSIGSLIRKCNPSVGRSVRSPLILYLIKSRAHKFPGSTRIRFVEDEASQKRRFDQAEAEAKEPAQQQEETPAAAAAAETPAKTEEASNSSAGGDETKPQSADKKSSKGKSKSSTSSAALAPMKSRDTNSGSNSNAAAKIRRSVGAHRLSSIELALIELTPVYFLDLDMKLTINAAKLRLCEKLWTNIKDKTDWRPEFIKLFIRKPFQTDANPSTAPVASESKSDQAAVQTAVPVEEDKKSIGIVDEKEDIDNELGASQLASAKPPAELIEITAAMENSKLSTMSIFEDSIIEFSFSPPADHSIGRRFDLEVEDLQKKVYKFPVHDLMPIRIIRHRFYANNRNRSQWVGMKVDFIQFKIAKNKIKNDNLTLRELGITGSAKARRIFMYIKVPGSKCTIL